MEQTQKDYINYLRSQFPKLQSEAYQLISDKLISPFEVVLPKKVLEQAQLVVKSLYSLRENLSYKEAVTQKAPIIAKMDPLNKSICMSYDFHLNHEGDLKLIEINTNAAFLLMGALLYQSRNQRFPIEDFSISEICENIQQESKLADLPLHTIAIVDEKPEQQRLFVEFLLYNQLFNNYGFASRITDSSDFTYSQAGLFSQSTKIDFIYNRCTDFFFDQPIHSQLKQAYLDRSCVFSPNPHEYNLLADKERMIEWTTSHENSNDWIRFIQPIKQHLLEARLLDDANKDHVWSNKKTFFIKPLTSFGSKGSYRGEGISRVNFEQLINKNCLAQEFCPAPEMIFAKNGIEPVKLKYDLRFYVYRDRVQNVMARLYQGQVTNLKTPYGGFATVRFE